MYLSLDAIESQLWDIGRQLGVEAHSFPTMGSSDHSGRAHIEVDAHGYHYVVCERGIEFERRTTRNLDDLYYWVFESIAESLARFWELDNRVPGQDTRRLWFPKQEELIGRLSSTWEDRLRLDHSAILKKRPFRDL